MSSLVERARRLSRQVVRQVRKSPGFFIAAILTLGLGIGSNAAMFSVVHAVLLKPLPFEQPERLVAVWNTAPGIGWKRSTLCAASYFTYLEENRTFENFGLYWPTRVTVTGREEPERLVALQVTEGFLPTLRINALLGRRFTRQDAVPGSPLHVVISYGYWQRHFGGDPGIVGRGITVNGLPREIIGVLPAQYTLVEPFSATPPDVLLPFQFDRARTTIMNFSYMGVARLKPGVSVADANRDVSRMIPMTSRKFQVASVLSPTFFEDARMGSDVHPLAEEVTGDVGRVLWVLMGTIGIVFLIACANVANLFLVRGEGRQQELAVRSALGAGRGRLARSLLSESLWIGIAGGVAGAGMAYAGIRAVRATAPAALPRVNEIVLGPAILLFVAALSLAAGLLFGLIPVLKFTAPRLAALRDGGRSASDGRDRHRTRSMLVVAEIALALILLVASGLMIRTFQALRGVNPGFAHGEQVLTFTMSVPRTIAVDAERTMRREFELIERMKQVAGVQSVGMSSSVSIGEGGMSNPFLVEHVADSPLSRRMKWVSPGFFETMGTPLIAGRQLTWNDVFSFAPVILINEQLARVYWKTPADAVGKRVRESNGSPWREVIGVVANTRDDGLTKDTPPTSYWPAMVKDFFFPMLNAQSTMTYVVRSTRAGSPDFLTDIRKAVWSVDRNMPLSTVSTMQTVTTESMSQTTFALIMLAIAASVALFLGVVGIYGVIAYVTAQRTREVGIRMALGARPAEVAQLFMRHGFLLAGTGILIGICGALALSRLMSSLLFGVTAQDPVTYVVVSGILAAVAMLAGYLPSRRAARLAPVTALRSDT